MRKMTVLVVCVGLCFAPVFSGAQTSTLYKHVDKDGKVTYSDKPPPKDQPPAKDGSTSKAIGMDNQRNVIKATPKSSDAPDTRAADRKAKSQQTAKEKEYEDARKAFEAARNAFETGKEPRDDEWRTVGASKGAPARVPSEAHAERVKQLEAAVAAAEKRLRDAERALK